MLLPVIALDRIIHLPVNTQTGKSPERGFFFRTIILDRFEKPDHPFLNKIVCLASHQVHGAGFSAHKFFIFFHQIIRNLLFSCMKSPDQFFITALVVTVHSASASHSDFCYFFLASFCRTISNARTPAATDAFRESMSPLIGIEAVKSHASFTRRLTPSPSFPLTSPMGPVRSRSYMV